MLDGTREVTTSERAIDQGADAGQIGGLACCQRFERFGITRDQIGDRVTRDVEYDMKHAEPGAPQRRQELGALDWARVEQTIPTGAVRRHGKVIASRISQLDMRVLLDAEVSTGRRLPVEGGRQHAVLDRHPLRSAIHQRNEAVGTGGDTVLCNLSGSELDRENEPLHTGAQYGGCRMRIKQLMA